MRNEQEWRAHLLSELREIKEDVKDIQKEMTTLKLKVAGIASAIASVLTLIFKA